MPPPDHRRRFQTRGWEDAELANLNFWFMLVWGGLGMLGAYVVTQWYMPQSLAVLCHLPHGGVRARVLALLPWVGGKLCHCGRAREMAAWWHEQSLLSPLEASVYLIRKYPKCWGCPCKEKKCHWGLWGECGAGGWRRGEDSFYPPSPCAKVPAVCTHCTRDRHGFALGLGTPRCTDAETRSMLARGCGWWYGLEPQFREHWFGCCWWSGADAACHWSLPGVAPHQLPPTSSTRALPVTGRFASSSTLSSYQHPAPTCPAAFPPLPWASFHYTYS